MEIQNVSTQNMIDYYNQLLSAQNVQTATPTSSINTLGSTNIMENIEQDPLYQYFSSKAADLNATISSFPGYSYTSTAFENAALIDSSELVNPKDYVLGAVIIDPSVNALAGELFKANANNFSVGDWRAIVEQAILANGGLGTSEEGFLAWSKDGHFVRLRNSNLTQEQNQKLANLSLEFGWPVEDLPSNMDESILSSPEEIVKMDEKLADFEQKISDFKQNPENDFTVKYGKQRFQVCYDSSTGMFYSKSYKLRSGIKGWFDKNVSKISTGLGIVKNIFKFIPGWGTIVSLCAGATKKIADWYKSRNGLYTQ